MKPLPSERPLILRLAAAFIAGALAGGSVTLAVASAKLDKVETAHQELLMSVGRLEQDNLRMQETLRGLEAKITVKKVTVKITGVPPVYRLELQKGVDPLLTPFIGQPFADLDYSLLYNLLDGRRMPAKDRLYQLKVRSILGGEDLIINLEAVPEVGPSSD